MTERDFALLMGRYCDGDAEAFAELYRQVAPRLFGYLMRLSGDRALAEDLLQQAFLKVHRARRAYVRGAEPMPWLFAIARRTFLDEIRRRKRAEAKIARGDDGPPERPAHISGKPAEEVDDSQPDPELLGAVLAALEDLPQNQREALILTKLNGKSVAEAAEIAGTTPGAMKVRAHRGYVALRKALASREESS